MQNDIKEIVKEKYTEVVEQNTSCCTSDCCGTELDANFNEDYQALEGYVPEADLGLGCGIPTEVAQMKAGDRVLDLGSGAGNDVFVARSIVGAAGKVIGVDMTEAMIEKAKQNKAKLGFENVEFILGEIENLPIPDHTVDVVISNCVLNLVPNKAQAYNEVYRVLDDGGHFSISDIVLEGELPAKAQEVAALYAGCVTGAMQKTDYMNAIKQAGFKSIQVAKSKTIQLPDELLRQYLDEATLAEFKQSGSKILSITVYAEK